MKPNQIIYPFGNKKLTLAANESIAVQTVGVAKVYRDVGYPNATLKRSLLGTVSNTETVYGPYTSGATIIVEAGAAEIAYETGLDPVVLSQRAAQTQGTPGVLNATGALTAAMMLSGIVTSSTAAAVAGTVPTGAVLDTELDNMQVGQSFDWALVNTGGNTFTVTAATGHTLVGVAAVVTVTSAMFRTRKTAASTYVTYRLTA